MDELSHDDLVERAAHWARSTMSYGLIVIEPCGMTYEPDVIGFKSGCRSILVECKTSRSDFFADKKKNIHRRDRGSPGDFRWYFTPPNLVEVSEIPDGWGLAECHDRIVRKVKHPPDLPTVYKKSYREEADILRYALRKERIDAGKIDE